MGIGIRDCGLEGKRGGGGGVGSGGELEGSK